MATKLFIGRAQVHVPNTCVWCESIQDVNWYCNDCQEALCERCFEGHQRARKTRNDVAVPITKATRQSGAVLSEVCTTHPGKSCDLFCTECHVVMCNMCFTQKYKQHTFKHLEEEIDSQKLDIQVQIKSLKSSLDVHYTSLTKRHVDSKSFKENVDVIRQTVQNQRLTLKAEIDSIADAVLVELSSLVDEEDKSHNQDCQSHETNIKEIKQLIRDVEQNTENMSSESLFELTGRLRTAIPLYDVTKKSVLPRQPHFVSGKLNADQIKSMIGYLQVDELEKENIGYKKKEIDSKEVSQNSTF
ncbi:transcription intermediary factor 1-alpha-like [Mizuhopecten yessoensis]|uniref:Transcription intermediary factor 1-alpha n=1 Tax=Mizuhopecten yessoensis TaxID=6573 RepID=A0A210Q4L5_MIZYE|nr:transcription intermediary factor 1-alpha-like [Mizuhopecten yessoensis]OWF43683.1 Transcription intermediary factor 1-alpha [Mizuhopecten yessoensis]